MDTVKHLRHELNKAHRLLNQSFGWQRDAEIVKAKQAQEIERLRKQCEGLAQAALNNGQDLLLKEAEIERLRIIAADYNALQQRANEIDDENGRLRAALTEAIEILGEGFAKH